MAESGMTPLSIICYRRGLNWGHFHADAGPADYKNLPHKGPQRKGLPEKRWNTFQNKFCVLFASSPPPLSNLSNHTIPQRARCCSFIFNLMLRSERFFSKGTSQVKLYAYCAPNVASRIPLPRHIQLLKEKKITTAGLDVSFRHLEPISGD